ncbi:hypothetical protein B6N60_05143 [Richelia sinica FACHB-800]|uniref:Uncharacterized protein n=1 Tax=Richelia sinica FACHB-800 TaxID=1357546 RepID=A0A975TE90_9NOST|nr:hypothetical protein B6N60_05143 [Richelia sinica FACHB-800]
MFLAENHHLAIKTPHHSRNSHYKNQIINKILPEIFSLTIENLS